MSPRAKQPRLLNEFLIDLLRTKVSTETNPVLAEVVADWKAGNRGDQ